MNTRTAQAIDRAISLISVVVLGASKQNWPGSFWTFANAAAPWNTAVLILAAGIFSFSPLTRRAEKKRIPIREIERRKILTAYGSMLERALSANLDISDPALHVWKVTKWKVKRLVTYRLSEGNQLRKFSPKKGIGVVGLAWRDAEEKSFDIEKLAFELDSKDKFEEVAERDGDAVMNLDWAAFARFRHRGAVFATPVMRREKVVGIVSFDASSRYSELAASGVPGELNKLAATLSDSMENLA